VAVWAASTTQHMLIHHTYACTVLADGLTTEFTGRPPRTSLSSPHTCSVTQVRYQYGHRKTQAFLGQSRVVLSV
jgi:hypothetical protein